MADNAFLFYEADNGDLRGTKINRMAYHVQDQIFDRFGMDYSKIVAFIEAGHIGGGYRYVTDLETVHEADEDSATRLEDGMDADVVFKVMRNGSIKVGELVNTITFVRT